MPPEPKPERRFLLRASLAGCLVWLAMGCSSTPAESLAIERQSIAGGVADTSHSFVFLLARESQNSGALCTASLIAPNLLLTARHCVSPGSVEDRVLCGDSVLGDPYPASAFFATNDPVPGRGSPFFTAREVRVPVQGGDTCGYDVALIILSDNVPSDVSAPAIPRIDREVTPGESYTAVGYGVNELGAREPRQVRTGLKIACEPGSCGEGVESTEFLGDTGICSGDSGGPALDDQGKVVGVVSRGGPDCSVPIYGTVTAWQDFIVDTAKDAATFGGYDPPFWVTTLSSDPPAVMTPSGEGGAGGTAAAAEGESCSSSAPCDSDHVCYSENGSNGVCRATCKATAECSAGESCETVDTHVSVCLIPTGSADESKGCSFSSPRGGGRRPLTAFSLIGLGLLWARRRASRAG